MDRWRIETGTLHPTIGAPDDVTERARQREERLCLENRLRQAERFEAMGALASEIAHDLNSILGAVLGFGERALRMVELGSRLHHDLSHVVAAGERGRVLVERILSVSRGPVGEHVPVHVERVVTEALSLLQATLPPAVRLRSRLTAHNAAILGDAAQIHRLLMNLGTNAAHAMKQPGTLTVSLEAIDLRHARQATSGAVPEGSWVVLQVADQGTGMTPEILGQIFEPFFTTKELGIGTGLGLWHVLRIVTQAGGAIDVESAPNIGSVFTVYLPRDGDAPEELRGCPDCLCRGGTPDE
jgi:signal transduction histidine kinase